MRTAIRLSLLVALVAALLSSAYTAAAADGCASNWFETYEVEMRSDKKVYRLGDTARIRMEVTDSATGLPVADADVAAGVMNDNFVVTGTDRTNGNGVAMVNLKLSGNVLRPGWVELRGMARTYHDEGDIVCAGVGFYGFESVKRAFRIKR